MGPRTDRDFAASRIVELRRYTLHPGQFDRLLAVFQTHLVAPQVAAGMRMGDQFRDRDDPDRFVWFRGFDSMEQRRRALEAFYDGPVWLRHRDEANATMVDSDDVLLLRPTSPPHPPRPASSADRSSATGESAVVQILALAEEQDCPAWITHDYHAFLESGLDVAVAMWQSEPSPNSFPRLPVRAGNYVVSLALFASDQDREARLTRLAAASRWEHYRQELAAAGIAIEWMHLALARPLTGSAPTDTT